MLIQDARDGVVVSMAFYGRRAAGVICCPLTDRKVLVLCGNRLYAPRYTILSKIREPDSKKHTLIWLSEQVSCGGRVRFIKAIRLDEPNSGYRPVMVRTELLPCLFKYDGVMADRFEVLRALRGIDLTTPSGYNSAVSEEYVRLLENYHEQSCSRTRRKGDPTSEEVNARREECDRV